MNNFFNFLRHFLIIVKTTWNMKNKQDMQEFLNFRHVLFVAEKSKLNPKVAMVRHFALFQQIPSIEDCIGLRNEVLEDSEKEDKSFNIQWEHERITPHDLIVVALNPLDSDLFVRGLFCDLSIKNIEEK